jgi:hypothetical protein
MARNRTIQYMINPGIGLIYSRVGSEVAIPVLDWEGMKPENNFKTNYNLVKFDVCDIASDLQGVIHTRKIPQRIKNIHRKFWGMKPLTRI